VKDKVMGGWKVWTTAAIVAAVAVARFFEVDPKIIDLALGLAGALGLIGLGHKIEKAGLLK